jgi:hypothetical protein
LKVTVKSLMARMICNAHKRVFMENLHDIIRKIAWVDAMT